VSVPVVVAEAVVPAPADLVYGILADYRDGHPSILPRPPFGELTVQEGGYGAGTRITVAMEAMGRERLMRMRVEEPEPGRVLLETDEDSGVRTRFTVDPLGPGRSRVRFETELAERPGLAGWLEGLLTPVLLRRVYRRELGQLADVAAHRFAAGESGSTPDRESLKFPPIGRSGA
jgi:hypothetical protein